MSASPPSASIDCPGCQRRERNGLCWLEPAERVGGLARVLVTTRLGGASCPPYDSLNLAMHVGDVPQRVEINRNRLRRLFPWRREPVLAEQVHGARIAPVGPLHAGCRWQGSETALAGVDGLCTDVPGLPLAILTADCAPVVLVDTEHRALGVAHAGWRGLAAGVIANLVAQMADCYGASTDLRAWIGPCIRACCYEVGPEVAERFPEAARAQTAGKFRLDLFAAVKGRLAALGVSAEGPGACTACEGKWFFSHRRASKAGLPATGRQACIACLPVPGETGD